MEQLVEVLKWHEERSMPYTVEVQLACLGEKRHSLFCKAVEAANRRIATKIAAKSQYDNQYEPQSM